MFSPVFPDRAVWIDLTLFQDDNQIPNLYFDLQSLRAEFNRYIYVLYILQVLFKLQCI